MITDWDDAYSNMNHIPGGADFPGRWAAEAEAFRNSMQAAGRADLGIAYGELEREALDLFLPEGRPKGLMIFIHGGYWMRFGREDFSHLANGAVERGWAAALPSYELTPATRVSAITRQIGRAIEVAANLVAGPLRIAGHSAGGHLVTRMVCEDSPLTGPERGRLGPVVSISGVHDLRPLLKTAMNETLGLDRAEAEAESPALNEPFEGARVICWVGSEERPEFVRQNDLLANIWSGLGADMSSRHDQGKHHFDVIEGLTRADSPLNDALLG